MQMGRHNVSNEEIDKEVAMPVFTASRQWLAVLLAVFMAFALSACGGGSSTTSTAPEPPPVVEPMPTPYEMAMEGIAAAQNAADAQAAYDAVKDDVTATQGDALQAAVDARVAELAMMAREADQKQALMDAAGMIDTSDLSTQALVDAARMAIAGLRQAIADAVDVDDTSMYQTMLDNAVDAVDMAQGGIDTETLRTNQMAALSDASDDLQAALAALIGATPTQALLDAANNALMALNNAITGGADLTETEKAPYQHEADNAAAPIQMAQSTFDDAEDADEAARIAAMAVTASQLHTAIGAPNTTAGNAAQRQAAYSGTDDVDITVTWGAADTAQALTVDEDAMVADRRGWTGMMFTAEPEGAAGTYEAVVYSRVGDPTVTEGGAFDTTYTLTDGETADVTSLTDYAERVASPSFDQSAGAKKFKPGSNDRRVMLGGSYHGVSGTYYCKVTDLAVGCTATVADEGFTLDGGTWTFKPGDPKAPLMDTSAADAIYASYGWWIHKNEDGEPVAASAFHGYRGTDAGTVGIADLRGTATYTGGAAGKYALRSSTGGTNDAGHFTADVELTATFAADHSIEGTISNFMGADDMPRDWSVALSNSVISNAGAIAGDPDESADPGPQMTTWSIGGTAADAGGEWSGTLREQGDDGVPGIATGTFYSVFGMEGKMVGAFGANE